MAGFSPQIKKGILDVTLFLAILAVWLAIHFSKPMGYESGFYCGDTSFSYPEKGDTISDVMLWVLAGCLPLLAIAITEAVFHHDLEIGIYKWLHVLANVYRFWGVSLFGLFLGLTFAKILKVTLCTLRPHFMDTCKPDFSIINCSDGYITDYVCTSGASEFVLNDIRQSFPSEHSLCCTFITLYLGYYFHKRMNFRFSALLKHVLIFAIAGVSVYVISTRITDHRHHPGDVVGGGFIGATVALWIILGLRKELATGFRLKHVVRKKHKQRQQANDNYDTFK